MPTLDTNLRDPSGHIRPPSLYRGHVVRLSFRCDKEQRIALETARIVSPSSNLAVPENPREQHALLIGNSPEHHACLSPHHFRQLRQIGGLVLIVSSRHARGEAVDQDKGSDLFASCSQ